MNTTKTIFHYLYSFLDFMKLRVGYYKSVKYYANHDTVFKLMEAI